MSPLLLDKASPAQEGRQAGIHDTGYIRRIPRVELIAQVEESREPSSALVPRVSDDASNIEYTNAFAKSIQIVDGSAHGP